MGPRTLLLVVATGLAGVSSLATSEPWSDMGEPEAPAASQIPSLERGNDEGAPADEDLSSTNPTAVEPKASTEDLARYRIGAPRKALEPNQASAHLARLALMVSYKNFSGLLGYEYRFNPFVGMAANLTYRSLIDVAETRTEAGPEGLLRLRIQHPYVIVPFADVGLASYTWSTRRPDLVTETSREVADVRKWGLDLQFARHFGVLIQETRRTFLKTRESLAVDSGNPLLAKRYVEVLFNFTF